MRRRDFSLVIALSASVAIHATLVGVVWVAPGSGEGGYRSVRGRTGVSSDSVYVEWEPARADEMGEKAGTGTGINSYPGEVTQLAREGRQDQAALSRDAAGQGRIGNWPTENLLAGEGGAGGNGKAADGRAVKLLPEEAPTAAPFGVAESAVATVSPVAPEVPNRKPANWNQLASSQPAPTTAPSDNERVAMVPAEQSVPADASAASTRPSETRSGTGAAGLPGSPQAADPYPRSESESDPFATKGSAEIHNGKVEARFGRKVKTTRPRLDLGGMLDVPTLQYPSVQLRVNTDEAGKVTSVQIIRSSGSSAIDHPVRLAMYDWWIEPPTDKNGNPVADVMIWTISFR